MKFYTTISGDTFDLIAKKLFNNELEAPSIMQANPTLLGSVVFSANVKVNIPVIEQVVKTNSTLPPWRR